MTNPRPGKRLRGGRGGRGDRVIDLTDAQDVTIQDLTIQGGNAGGGLDNDGGSLALMGTTVSGNTAAVGPDINGPFTDLGGNQIG